MAIFTVPGSGGDYDTGGTAGVSSLPGGGDFESDTGLNLVLNKTIDNFISTISFTQNQNFVLNQTIDEFVSEINFEDGSQRHLVVDATVGDFGQSITFGTSFEFLLDQTIGDFSTSISFSNPLGFRVDSTIDDPTPYLRFVGTPFSEVSFDPFHDPVWIAVEVDGFDSDDNAITLRLGNRGVIKRTVSGTLYQYEPRLSDLPLQLGMTINVTTYGSPIRAEPNAGQIKFAIDEAIWGWFAYRLVGQVFRVYSGQTVNPVEADVDDDLTLVYKGRIAGIKHDTIEATFDTTDESVQWDNPLVTSFYDNTFAIALRGKPKPFVWGSATSIEPQIENESDQIYGVSYRSGGLDSISQVRVGGIPWNLNFDGPPGPGEWTPDLANGRFTLGSPTLGMDVRCDATQGNFTIAGLIRNFIEGVSGEVDDNSMAALDTAMPGRVSYVTTTSPVNFLDALDDVVTTAGCWWGVNHLGKAIAGVIDVPKLNSTLLLDEKNIKTLELNTVHPPAWRIRVGYLRNWSPETSFASSVLETTKAKYKEDGQVYEPHYENTTIKNFEPRAVDVPQLKGTLTSSGSAKLVQDRLITAWGTIRSLFDITCILSPSDINLYDTISVNYRMVSGNFIITSAIRAIGVGLAKLQIWGTIGDYAVQPPEPILPEGISDVSIWAKTSGSGTFEVGVDCPSTATRLWIRGIGAGGGGGGAYTAGGFTYGGGGGGAGGYFEDVITVTASSALAWEVGEGGAGGITAGGFNTAGTGGDTTFGPATGFGGSGGKTQGNDISGGDGGGASGTTVTVTGGPGGVGYFKSSSDPDLNFTGNGGSGAFGGGGFAKDTTVPYTQGAPGGGGGSSATLAGNGSDGNPGMIIVISFS